MTEQYIFTPFALVELVGVDYSYEKRPTAWKNFEKRIEKKNIYAFPGFFKIVKPTGIPQEQKNILQGLGNLSDLRFEEANNFEKRVKEIEILLKNENIYKILYGAVMGPATVEKSNDLFAQFVKILALSATDPSYKLIYTDSVYSEGESKDMLGNEMADNGIENIFRRIEIEKNIIKLNDFFTRDE